MNDWLKLLENHALLPITCFGILVGLYRLGSKVISEVVKPSCERLVSKGLETMVQAQRTMTKIEETQVVIVGAVTRLEQQASEQRSISARQQDRLQDIDEKLGELGQHVRRPTT